MERLFDRLMPLIVSEQNIILAYRKYLVKTVGAKLPAQSGKTIVAIQSLPSNRSLKPYRNKLNYYQTKKG